MGKLGGGISVGCIRLHTVGCWTKTRVSQGVGCKCGVLGRERWVLDKGAGDAINWVGRRSETASGGRRGGGGRV